MSIGLDSHFVNMLQRTGTCPFKFFLSREDLDPNVIYSFFGPYESIYFKPFK